MELSQEQQPPTGSANLRIGAAVAQVEGLYTALRTTAPGARRDQLMADLARAGRRLAAVTEATAAASAAASTGGGGIVPPRSRWQRRRALAARGAGWLAARTEP
ncbi:hypothetical protein AB0I22_05720 [Streptomyces sp. NPDC050610]|uniref:hypothetical protein n=1 Tax=Streptomyces sp. NPDC050610 TaxID=3157097 RepID=UPI00344A3A66